MDKVISLTAMALGNRLCTAGETWIASRVLVPFARSIPSDQIGVHNQQCKYNWH